MNQYDERLLKVLGVCANLKARINVLTVVNAFLWEKMGGDSAQLLKVIEEMSQKANEDDLLNIGERDPEAAEFLDVLKTLKRGREQD